MHSHVKLTQISANTNRTYAKVHALWGNTLREAALPLHELTLRENKGFGYCLRKS